MSGTGRQDTRSRGLKMLIVILSEKFQKLKGQEWSLLALTTKKSSFGVLILNQLKLFWVILPSFFQQKHFDLDITYQEVRTECWKYGQNLFASKTFHFLARFGALLLTKTRIFSQLVLMDTWEFSPMMKVEGLNRMSKRSSTSKLLRLHRKSQEWVRKRSKNCWQ